MLGAGRPVPFLVRNPTVLALVPPLFVPTTHKAVLAPPSDRYQVIDKLLEPLGLRIV